MMKEIKKVGKDLGIAPTIIRDEELKERGFGGMSCLKSIFLVVLNCNIMSSPF